MESRPNAISAVVLGASGYTGAELVRILSGHPTVTIAALTADRHAGRALADIFPHFHGLDIPDLIPLENVEWDGVDVVFCCLPHGTTQTVVRGLPPRLKVIDLSADFRLSDTGVYAEWYGHAHQAPELQGEAVYGLTEISRSQIAAARLVANPGCYPTSAQLPLIPLLSAGVIVAEDIIIDAKSGVSGAGRAAKQANLYAEVGEGVRAYGIASHHHAPEIEQGLSAASGKPVTVTFTPHLMPMNRGILATIYVRLAPGHTVADIERTLVEQYGGESFVHVLPAGQAPTTHQVRGTNSCLIGVHADRVAGKAIMVSALDNLVKGASGQAVQNMNLMFDLPEDSALSHLALFP